MADYVFPALDTLVTSSDTTLDNAKRRINNIESSNFNTAYEPATSASQRALNYGEILHRNTIIENTANDLITENKSKFSSQRDTYSRQAEINEWEAQNKMDTLFFLQLLFIYLSVLVVSLYLRQIGLFPGYVFGIIAGIGLIIVGLVLWNRASYTSSSRDQRFWNRRFIGLDDATLQAQIQCNITS